MRCCLGVSVALVLVLFLPLGAMAAAEWSPHSLSEVDAAITGLEFDAFIEASFREYILRSPEWVTSLGIADDYEIRNDALDTYDQDYLQETAAIERLILERLREFDPSTLTDEQRTTYEVADWYWDDIVRGQAFADHKYLVHYMDIRSAHGLMEYSINRRHPFNVEDDVIDYLARLEKVAGVLDSIIAETNRRAALGIYTPRPALEWAIGAIRSMGRDYILGHAFYETLKTKGAEIESLSADALAGYLEQARDIINSSVKPAYRRLEEAVLSWIADAPSDISMSQFSGGQEAYAYFLRHHTSTDMTADQIHGVGQQEVARIQQAILTEAAGLGYDGPDDMTSVYEWVGAQSGVVFGDEAVAYASSLIEGAASLVLSSGALRRLPQTDVVADGVPNGGYYSRAPLDGSTPGTYFVSTGGASTFVQPTIAYHEAIPGHHVQIALAQELDMPLLRRNVGFTGYLEGWALYSEQLMYELGAYDDDPLGNLGRLQYELLRAARLVTDTGIHEYGWSREEAIDYVSRTMGVPQSTAEYRVMRYTVIPGQATAYKVGMIELLRLRELAQETLGDAFDLATFHDIILDNGAVPLPFVAGLVDAWIVSAGEGS